MIPRITVSLRYKLSFLGRGAGLMEGDGGRGESGEGEGGKTSRELPRKEDEGNLCRDCGIVPSRRLKDRSSDLRLGSWRSGISPESELRESLRTVSFVLLEMEGGMLPLNVFSERFTTVRLLQTEKFDGRGPDRRLDWR